jgi:hypothetical protein
VITVDATKKAALDAQRERLTDIQNDAGTVALRNRLATATNAQIDTWFDQNVTTLAQSRAALKAMAKLLAMVVRDDT